MNFFDWVENKVFTDEVVGIIALTGIGGIIGFAIIQLFRHMQKG